MLVLLAHAGNGLVRQCQVTWFSLGTIQFTSYSLCAELHACSNSLNSRQIALNLKHKAFDFCKQHYRNDLEIASVFSQNLRSTPFCTPYCNCDNTTIFVNFIFQSKIPTS